MNKYRSIGEKRSERHWKMIEPSFNVPMDDVKRILAEYFGVDLKKVVKNQYSFTVIGGKLPEKKERPEE